MKNKEEDLNLLEKKKEVGVAPNENKKESKSLTNHRARKLKK
jgi:hypothetical protein